MLVRRIAPAGIIKAGSFIAGYDMEAEHPVDAQIVAEFLETCIKGVLPGGQTAKTLPLDPAKLVESWRKEGEMSFPGIGPKEFQPKTPNDWFYNAVGSNQNPEVLAFLEKDLNKKKGSIFGLQTGLGEVKIDKLIKQIASDGPDKGKKKLLLGEYPRFAAVFDYMNDDPVKEKFDLSIKGLRNAARYAEIGWDLVGMESMWKEFEAAAFPNYEKVGKSNMASRTADSIIKELEKMRALEDKINLNKLLGKE
ncbi:hypothetical protein FDECE_17395 [Fusarium decemcellulare]|nr:hypothetical protein FDECE_17395 [Fusarium decemcellulare]